MANKPAGSVSSMNATRDPYVGQLLGERYRILRVIGSGGMATVYVAQHTLIGRKVAIKVLHAQLARDAACVKRFVNEGRAAGMLGHPNIVESTDMGFTPDGAPFLVLELLDGVDLASAIKRSGPFPVERAARVAIQIASALQAAHASGIVHRDLKPENVYLISSDQTDDHVKVLDFGISKFLQAGQSSATLQGTLMGTPSFMAPEQISAPDTVDRRSDVYALGAILYNMLVGRAPFSTTPFPLILSRVLSETPLPLASERPELPPALIALVDRAMAKSPAARFQRMDEFFVALLPFAGGSLPPGMLSLRVNPDGQPGGPTLPAVSVDDVLEALTPPPVQPRPARWGIPIAAGMLLGAGVIVTSVTLRTHPQRPPATVPAPIAPPSDDQALGRYLDESEQLAADHRWSASLAILDKARALDSRNAELNIRLLRLRDRVERAMQEPPPAVSPAAAPPVAPEPPRSRHHHSSPSPLAHAAPQQVTPPVAPAPLPPPVVEVPSPVAAAKPVVASITPRPQPAKPAVVDAPRLPETHRVQTIKELSRSLRIIEQEAIHGGKAPAPAADGATTELAQSLFQSFAPGQVIEIRPRAIYFLIVNGARAGKTRGEIAAEIKKSKVASIE